MQRRSVLTGSSSFVCGPSRPAGWFAQRWSYNSYETPKQLAFLLDPFAADMYAIFFFLSFPLLSRSLFFLVTQDHSDSVSNVSCGTRDLCVYVTDVLMFLSLLSKLKRYGVLCNLRRKGCLADVVCPPPTLATSPRNVSSQWPTSFMRRMCQRPKCESGNALGPGYKELPVMDRAWDRRHVLIVYGLDFVE
jgi:hypothetical protein